MPAKADKFKRGSITRMARKVVEFGPKLHDDNTKGSAKVRGK